MFELFDKCNEATGSLEKTFLVSDALSDFMLINFMFKKVDQPLKQRWELMFENDKIPDLDSFLKFIEREARSVEEKV